MLTQSVGEHLKGVIANTCKGMRGDTREFGFYERVEEVSAEYCQKYGFDIDSVMTCLLYTSDAADE